MEMLILKVLHCHGALVLLMLLVEQKACRWAFRLLLDLCSAEMMAQRFWMDFWIDASSAVLRPTASQWVSY